jgi:hypothetical protein
MTPRLQRHHQQRLYYSLSFSNKPRGSWACACARSSRTLARTTGRWLTVGHVHVPTVEADLSDEKWIVQYTKRPREASAYMSFLLRLRVLLFVQWR